MSAEKSMAIVLRRIEYSESSYVVTLFTEDFGKLTGLAKGARRPKSALENALDLLAISRVVFLRKSSGAMDLLTEARLERPFRAARRDLARLYAGYYVIELLGMLTDDHDPHPVVFRNAKETIIQLDQQGDVGLHVLRFELSTLKDLGHLPSLGHCAACGRPVGQANSRVAFGPLAGGVLCPACRSGQRHVVSLSRPALETLQALVERPVDVDLIKQAHAVRGELRGLMNNYVAHLLGKRPRMLPFLASLR